MTAMLEMPAMARCGFNRNTGSSEESKIFYRAASNFAHNYEQSRALFGKKEDAISQLDELVVECAETGWDGDGALPLNDKAAAIAEQFIRAIPNNLPMPEFAPEPDGCISLDWIQSRQRLLSLSVGPTERLAYAWLNGTDKGHGVVRFDGERVPRLIEETLRWIMQ